MTVKGFDAYGHVDTAEYADDATETRSSSCVGQDNPGQITKSAGEPSKPFMGYQLETAISRGCWFVR